MYITSIQRKNEIFFRNAIQLVFLPVPTEGEYGGIALFRYYMIIYVYGLTFNI